MIHKLTITETIKGLKDRKFSASELLNSCIKTIEDNKRLNVFITETFDLARKQAKESERKYLNGDEGLLEGIPMAVKDIFCTNGIRTTNASKILENFVPQYESTITSKLFGHGAVMVGKANLDEFAMGSANTNSAFGPVINPWKSVGSNEDLTPGGSSGGSAASVAASMAMFALGTDTGGSVRLPASYCGVVGFKPTYGRCSRYGIIAFASSLDQAGIFTRSIDDMALVASVVMGHDDKDSTSETVSLPNFDLNQSVKGMRIGIPKEYNMEGLDPEIKKLWMDAKDMLQREGAEIVDVTLPHTKHGVAAYYVIAPAEASSNLARYDGVKYGLRVWQDGMKLDDMYEATRTEGFGDEVKRRIMIGTYVLSSGLHDSYFRQAQKVRRLIVTDFKHAFEKVDALLTPVTTNTAFALNDKASLDPVALYMNDAFTIPASMACLPAISVPGRLSSKGLPIGLQILANKFMEEPLFRVAKTLERCFDFNKSPEGF